MCSWKSILLYTYTAKILFAPFGSSGSSPVAGSSLNPGVPHEGVDAKIVYELATKVRVFMFPLSLAAALPQVQIASRSLCDIAYENIRSSTASENIVGELLSAFSAECVFPFFRI